MRVKYTRSLRGRQLDGWLKTSVCRRASLSLNGPLGKEGQLEFGVPASLTRGGTHPKHPPRLDPFFRMSYLLRNVRTFTILTIGQLTRPECRWQLHLFRPTLGLAVPLIMATMTSTHRVSFSSARLTPAPTQNTAPVHEFCCLYTRDLHKKSKKWHDGSARFHTFNRRVMVYDDTRNFIGDLHYQEEDFGEGVEIRLDRGVLVEVGERLGQTETDLAPILDRQRPEKDASPRNRPVSLANRLPSMGQSQRPKSLVDLLGPTQGRLGRARLPYQSPYEQRHQSTRPSPVEPPTKRQRLSSDKENDSNEVHQPVRAARPSLPQPMQPSKPVRQPVHRHEPHIDFEDVLDLSSDEDPQRRLVQPAQIITKSTHNRKQAAERRPPSLIPTNPKPKSKPRVREAQQRTENAKSSEKGSALQEIGNPSTRPAAVASRSSRAGTARLLLGAPTPRPKLLCIELFSNHTSTTPDANISAKTSPRQEDVNSPPVPDEEPQPSFSNDFEPFADGAPSPTSNSIPRMSALEPEHVQVPDSSPLFVPEEILRPPNSPPGPLLSQEFPLSQPEDDNTFQSLESFLTLQQSLPLQSEQDSLANQRDIPADVEPVVANAPRALSQSTDFRKGVALEEADIENQNKVAVSSPTERAGPERQYEPDKSLERELSNGLDANERTETAREATRFRGALDQASDRQQYAEPERRTISKVPPSKTKNAPLPGHGPIMPEPVRGDPHAAKKHSAGFAGRPFRRVLSENDALQNGAATMVLEEPVTSAPTSPMCLLNDLSVRRTVATFESPSKVQRSVSDTMAVSVEAPRIARPTGDGREEPTGPWTVDEAFLLFDWWPGALQKPTYWQDPIAAPVSRPVPPPAQVFRGGIMTARQYLRDDVNVI